MALTIRMDAHDLELAAMAARCAQRFDAEFPSDHVGWRNAVVFTLNGMVASVYRTASKRATAVYAYREKGTKEVKP